MAKINLNDDLSSQQANDTFLLKTEDDIITGILSLQQGVDVNRHVSDLQEYLFTIADVIGIVGEADPNAKIYANTNYIANGDNRKVAIEKLDAQAKVNADNIASNLVLITTNQTNIQNILDSIGVASGSAPLGVGIATLDADGRVPLSQLPNSLLLYLGTWDASTNTPTLADGTGTENTWYRVNVAGSQDLGSGSITFAVGDKIVHNGTTWEKWDTNDEVTSVFGRSGDIVAQAGDYNASQVGLGNVTNDAQLKREAGDINTFTEKVTLNENDIVIIEDSEDSFNKKKAKLENLLGGGGGGGSFLFELNGDISPIESIESGISTLDFDFESNMEVYASISVPAEYKAGDQIFLRNTSFFSAGSSDNVLFKAETTLIQAGDDITSLTNKHLSINTELTLSTANVVTSLGDLDLTDVSGEVNTIAVAPNDILLIRFYRDNTNETISSSEDARLLKFSPSISFTG